MADSAAAPTRVLIVDDIAETRENIKKLLQFESDLEIVGGARTGQEAIQLAAETKPHVVLMDINMPDMDGITATEAVLEEIPYAQIIILSVQNEPDYMRRAMLAGARDFIPKPPSGEELIKAIRELAERAKREENKLKAAPQPVMTGGGGFSATGRLRPEGKILAVYSAKGGVGCTTLATNIAVGLNSPETPAVLVDTNMQFGDISVFLNLQVKNSMIDLASRADDLDTEIVEEILMSHQCGLKVLASPPRPEMAEEVHADQVRKVLQYLKRIFAYVIVDTSSTVDDVTLAVLDVTDMLIAVATPDIPAIKDARLLFDLLGVLGLSKERVFFVLNKMDRNSNITAKAVAENLKRPVDGEIPADERAVTTSINRGVPLMLGDKSRPPARNLLELIGSIKQRLYAEASKEQEEEAKVSDRPRLFKSA